MSTATIGPRLAAVRAVEAVLDQGRSLSDALPRLLEGVAAGDRALAQALAFGALRHHRRLAAVADGLLARPLRRRDRAVHHALVVGLYQLVAGTVAAHAAVSETAAVARALRKEWAVRVINASLRRFQREHHERLATVDEQDAVRWSLPDWLAEAWRSDWPQDWQGIATASNTQAPMTLRVAGDPAAYVGELATAGLAARVLPGLPDAVQLEQPLPVGRLPGFRDGRVSVQDGAAQFAARLVEPQAGERVLDACAAPGGKTAHLLELAPHAEVVALDSDPRRLDRVGETLRRTGHNAALRAGDAGDPSAWWDGRAFDRVLLDAPCSATGVIRRHPDIKWLRRADDIDRLASVQRRLLDALWPVLAPGGKLVYATCSLLRAENEAVVTAFARAHPEVVIEPPGLPVGRALAAGHQILPGGSDLDGFYYACLRKP